MTESYLTQSPAEILAEIVNDQGGSVSHLTSSWAELWGAFYLATVGGSGQPHRTLSVPAMMSAIANDLGGSTSHLTMSEAQLMAVIANEMGADPAVSALNSSFAAMLDGARRGGGAPAPEGPTLSNLIVTPIDGFTAALEVTTDDATGVLYAVAVPDGAAAPSAAQIEAGTDGDDVAADWADSVEVESIGSQEIGPNGLSDGEWVAYVVQKDEDGNYSNVLTQAFELEEEYNYVTALGSKLIAAWDADDLATADGAAVASWADRVGGYALTQGTGSAQPLMDADGIGGGKAVLFDGADDVLTVAGTGVAGLPLNAEVGELWVLCKDLLDPASDTSARYAFSYGSTTTIMRTLRRSVAGGNMRPVFSLQGSNISTTTGNAYNTAKLLRGVFDGANASLYVDGVLAAGPTAPTTPATTNTRIRMGSHPSSAATAFWRGHVAVALILSDPSPEQIADLTAYLKARGGIA